MPADPQPSSVLQILNSISSQEEPQRWQLALAEAKQQQLATKDLLELYRTCFRETAGPKPIWWPSMQEGLSNVRQWAGDLGLENADDFLNWSVGSRASFWESAIQRLNIQFDKPPQEILDLSQGIPHAGWMTGAKLNIVNSCFQANEDAIAIVARCPGSELETWTIGHLKSQAARVANSLVDAGFKVGDAIGVFMPMTRWSVAIYLGIIMAGCHVVSIADSFAPPEIATRLKISNAKAIFTYDFQIRAGKKLPLFRRLAEASSSPAIVIPVNDTLEVDVRDQDFAWSEFLSKRSSFQAVSCNSQETINVLFSSGTTGDPKAIPWNHLTPIKCAVDGHCHQNIMPGDVCAWPTNLGWMMGPWLIFASLINRATIALYEDAPMGEGFGRFIEEAKVTMLGVVPTIVKAWQKSQSMESLDWSTIKVFSSTGESSQPETMTYLSALAGFKPVIEYCGGTEIGGGYVTSIVDRANYPAAFNSHAVGLDFVLLEKGDGATQDKLRTSAPNHSDHDDTVSTESNAEMAGPGEKASAGETRLDYREANEGEVFLRPPSIGLSNRLINRDHFETYYAATPTIVALGQLRRHGDHFRAVSTEEGTIYVAGGRVDDTMNLGGIKVSSAEIERVLNQCELVIETAAVAQSQSDGPDQLVIYAVCAKPLGDSEHMSLLKAMNQQLKEQLNPLFRVSELRVEASLPRTASGKVMRRKLRTEN